MLPLLLLLPLLLTVLQPALAQQGPALAPVKAPASSLQSSVLHHSLQSWLTMAGIDLLQLP